MIKLRIVASIFVPETRYQTFCLRPWQFPDQLDNDNVFWSYGITIYIAVVVTLLYGGMLFWHVPHLRITKREDVGKEDFIKMKRRSIKHTVILEKLSVSESAHEQQAIGAKNTS